jgi:hypothetical protein
VNAAKARAFLQEAAKWVHQSETPAISENHALKRSIDLALYKQARLEEAAATQMSVGVYGASQAGKSYFVSALAKGKRESVFARIGTREVNFLTDINPSGGRESTGLVTRFTYQTASETSDFPIRISLLSEIDLVKIVANSFYEDLEPDAEADLASRIARVKDILRQDRAKGVANVKVEDVVDLSFYCDRHFATRAYYAALKQVGFWTRLEQLLPNSDLRGRQTLYSLLWDGSAPYDRLFEHLSGELARLGGVSGLLCEPDALFDTKGDVWARTETSVINVVALDSLGTGQERQVRVMPQGKLSAMPILVGIGALSGLAAEITVSIAGDPQEFFAKADLLDFPGARSRHPIDRSRFDVTTSFPVEHFLRGKVAYLFERYCNNFGMSALLLCVGPSNQEVVGLNRLIEDWISGGVGARPDQRDGKPKTLFAVLTKFDTEFVMDAGRATDESRWTTRITASLVKPFGGNQSPRTQWLEQWDTASAFRNTYWWRSPSADQPGLVKYGPNRTEIAILDERATDISRLRQSYLESPAVRKHFNDAEAAWEAALTLNDGGAAYIVADLSNVCKKELRDCQILDQHAQNCDAVASKLRNFYVSNNSVEMQVAKATLADGFIRAAAEMLERRSAGAFLSALVMDDQSGIASYEEILADLHWATRTEKDERREADRQGAVFGLLGLAPAPDTIGRSGSHNETLVRAFAVQWASSLREKFQNPTLTESLGIESDFIETVASEALVGLEQSGAIKSFAEALERQRYGNDGAWKSATILTTLLNDFLVYTTIKNDRPRDVTRPDGSVVRIFARPFAMQNETHTFGLSENPMAYGQQFMADWAMGFYDMIKQNAFLDFQDGQKRIENEALGRVLDVAKQVKVA